MNNNTNPNLPANAISNREVKAGMLIVRNGLVREVAKVLWYGSRAIVTLTTGERVHIADGGTMRLYTSPDDL